MIKTVARPFESPSEAASDLRATAFLDSDVSVIASDQQRPVGDVRDTDPDKASGTAKGIVAGGALGGAAGLAVGLMGLAIPGIGPILAAGPIATALAGAGAGAVAGGLVGGLAVDRATSGTSHR